MRNNMLILLKYLVFVCMIFAYCPCSNAQDLEDLVFKSIEELIEIEIYTAGKKEEKVSDIPASVVIITSEEIKRYGYTSIQEILKNVPGLYAIDDIASYGTTFGVRGFWTGNPRNIIFLLNGIKQNDSLFNFYLTQHFNIPVEAIDRIEIVRGPMSVIYGEGAFFGAINIITDKISEKTVISTKYGSHNTVRTALKSSGKEGNLDYAITVGYYNTDGPNEPLDKMTNNIEKLEGINHTNNTTNNRLENKSKHLNLSLNHDHFYSKINFNDSTDEKYIMYPSYSDGSSYNRRNFRFKLGYKKQVSDRFKYDISVTYHKYYMHLDSDWESPGLNYTQGESSAYETELLTYFDFSESFDVTTGFCVKKDNGIYYYANLDKFGGALKDSVKDSLFTSSLFTQARYTPYDNLKLVAGMRFEKFSKYNYIHYQKPANTKETRMYDQDNIEFIPRLAAIYSINQKNNIKILYGKAISRPSFFQVREQVYAQRANIEREFIHSFELNYTTIPFDCLSISSSVFYNILDNLIVRTAEIQQGKLVVYGSNAGKIITKGMECTGQLRIANRFHAELSLVYQESKDQRDFFNDTELPYSPRFLGYLKASYKFQNGLSLAITGNYIDEMETKWDETSINANGSYERRIGLKTDDYLILSANVRLDDFIRNGLFVSIHGSNIFDKQYLHPCNYANYFEKGSIGQGRLLMMTMGLEF